MEEEGGDRGVLLASAICGTLFSLLSAASFSILWTVNWRPWRIYSWIFARKWPNFLHGPQLHLLCGFLNLSAWFVVVSPIMVLIIWGSWLIVILNRDLIGLAVIMAFYWHFIQLCCGGEHNGKALGLLQSCFFWRLLYFVHMNFVQYMLQLDHEHLIVILLLVSFLEFLQLLWRSTCYLFAG